ncbi:MAG TPA: hypothetical protein VHZ54_03440 [Solirubrobacterales bacterium]|jgi:hypothetical protein|nr:hypothetical protein [Solirubrobacterales bacterium]
MKKRLSIALAVALAASAVFGPGSASAATVFGSPCAADKVAEKPGAVWISTAHPGGAFPVTAPISGVITEWLINANLETSTEGEFSRMFQQRLVVARVEGRDPQTNAPTSVKVVGEASGGALNLKGTSTYLTRLPVQQGDYLGIAGNPFTIFCETGNEADTFAFTTGGTPVGSTLGVGSADKLQVPIVARIEPDVDGDGYGDETQDKCPQSAAYQSPCPTVQLSSLALSGTKAVSVYVTSSLVAPVSVTGSVKVGKGKTATLPPVAARAVTPGTLARYQLNFTRTVTKALASLSTKKSLTLTISASATNVAGTVSTATSTLKLQGQKKPVHHKKHRHHKPAKNQKQQSKQKHK